MEVYGDAGMAIALNNQEMHIAPLDSPREHVVAAPLVGAMADPFSYLKAVVEGSIVPAPHDLSALENNIMVTRILDAARESAATGKRVYLTK